MDESVFIEKIISRRKNVADRLIIIGIIIAVMILTVCVPFIPYANQFWVIIDFGLIYGGYMLIKSRSIEYEYIVTNGDLDIDKIVAQRKRKRIFSGNCKAFEIVARVKSEHYNDSVRNMQTRIDARSSPDSEGAYFIITSYKGQRTLILFEPDERMLKSFKMFIPRIVFA